MAGIKKHYNVSTIASLIEQGYHPKHVAIIMGCAEKTVRKLYKQEYKSEATLKFITKEEKQRLFVLDKFLRIKPLAEKWCSDDYYYITILRFLLVPRDVIYNAYKTAPQTYVSNAYKERSPLFQQFNYARLNINLEEYRTFVLACYKIIRDPDKWC